MRILLIFITLLIGCTSSIKTPKKNYQIDTRKYPWENWQVGKDIYGNNLDLPQIIQADELYLAGNKEQAIEILQELDLSELGTKVEYNVLYRIWSYKLNDPMEGLSNIRSYCQRNIPADKMPDYFALLFAYAHGSIGNSKKSIAWFSYVLDKTKSEKIRLNAIKAIKLLFQNLDNYELSYAQNVSNPDIKLILENEISYRDNPGYIYKNSYKYFWESELRAIEEKTTNINNLTLILPLDGKYKNYGVSTNQGVKLALDKAGIKYNLIDGNDTNKILMDLDSILQNTNFLVGPPTANIAEEVAVKAREKNIPTIILTKNSDFIPSGTVYRFAPTFEQQLDSIIRLLNSKFNYTKYAIVYPQNSGNEVLSAYRKKLVEFNLENSVTIPYDNSSARFNGIDQKLFESNIEAVLFAGNSDELLEFQREQSLDFRQKIKVFGLLNLDEKELSKNEFFNGVVFLRAMNTNLNLENEYQTLFGKKADFFVYQGYDLGRIIIESLEYSQNKNLALSESIRQIQFKGYTGDISNNFNEIRRKFTVVEVNNGTIKEIGM